MLVISLNNDGQTSYGTYDAMFVEIIKHLNERITQLEDNNQELLSKIEELYKTNSVPVNALSSTDKN